MGPSGVQGRKVRGIEAVLKVDANVLAKQQRDWAMRDADRDAETGMPAILPTVTKNKILEAVKYGLVPHLFLDELEKIKLDSGFQLNEFYEIIDAIQSNGGQVVVCSNLSELGLKYALGKGHGEAIVRRLIGPRMNEKAEKSADPTVGGFLVDCTAGTFKQNYELPGEAVPVEPQTIKPTAGPGEVQYRKKPGSNISAVRTQPTPAVPPPAATPRRTAPQKGAFAFDPSRIHHR